MFQIRKILVPTDYSNCAGTALMHALQLAMSFDAEVHLLHVIEEGLKFDHDRHMPDVSADVAAGFAKNALPGTPEKRGKWNTVPIRRILRSNPEAAPVILEYAQQEDVDLIVMGTHGHRSVDRFLNDLEDRWPIGKTTEVVIRYADRPVFTVGPRSSRKPEFVNRILAPVDFSGHSLRSLSYAKYLAEHYEVPLHLLHVLPKGETKSEAEVLEALRVFHDAAEGPDVEVRMSVRRGIPAQEILEEASRDQGSIVVLSSHGQKGINELRLGKDAEAVIRAAPNPVFTDKAFGKSLLRNTRRIRHAVPPIPTG